MVKLFLTIGIIFCFCSAFKKEQPQYQSITASVLPIPMPAPVHISPTAPTRAHVPARTTSRPSVATRPAPQPHVRPDSSGTVDSSSTAIYDTLHPAPVHLSLSEVIDTCAAYYGIPREVIIGVAFSETRIGKKGIGRDSVAANLFGLVNGKYDEHPNTPEYSYRRDSIYTFRKFKHRNESVASFCRFVKKHYPYLFNGRPLERWLLYGYGNSNFEQKGYFLQFANYKIEN